MTLDGYDQALEHYRATQEGIQQCAYPTTPRPVPVSDVQRAAQKAGRDAAIVAALRDPSDETVEAVANRVHRECCDGEHERPDCTDDEAPDWLGLSRLHIAALAASLGVTRGA